MYEVQISVVFLQLTDHFNMGNKVVRKHNCYIENVGTESCTLDPFVRAVCNKVVTCWVPNDIF